MWGWLGTGKNFPVLGLQAKLEAADATSFLWASWHTNLQGFILFVAVMPCVNSFFWLQVWCKSFSGNLHASLLFKPASKFQIISLLFATKARLSWLSRLGGRTSVKQHVMLPHDIVAAMFAFKDGNQFFQTWVGVPGDTWIKKRIRFSFACFWLQVYCWLNLLQTLHR